MLELGRGQTTFTEVPDGPPPGPFTLFVTGLGDAATPNLHSGGAPALMSASTSMPMLQDTTPVVLSGGSPQMMSVASVVTEGPGLAVERGGGTLPSGGDGGGTGEIGRDGETFASLSIDSSAYADHGWFIVPSASNEYGDAISVAGDGFSFDVAIGGFASDWVFVA
jgi:hypothetical protein